MNYTLNLVIKRYLIILSLITFSSILISPDLHLNSLEAFLKSSSAIIFYRFNIFSIFSLLFATLTAIQSLEKEGLNVALSISGRHSFSIMLPTLLFGGCLALVSLTINEFFLPTSLKQLKKDAYLSSYTQNLQVHRIDDQTIFFQKGLKNFVSIDGDKNVIYAKSAEVSSNGITLFNADSFKKVNSQYEKISSENTYHLQIDPLLLKEPSQLKISASLSTLLSTIITPPDKEIHFDRLQTALAYRICLPLLHIFAVSIAMLFGFSQRFRRRKNLCLILALTCSLFAFYLLECSAILASGSIVSPLIFIFVSLPLFIITPSIAFLKKV